MKAPKFHPIASLFPAITKQEFESLKHDIQVHGQLTPITRWQGQIVDGRHRFSACQSLGIEPLFEDLPDAMTEQEVRTRTISLNLHRRQLTLEQRAAIAATLTTTQKGANQHSPAGLSSISQKEAARLLAVSLNSLKRMQQVQKTGIAELLEQLTAGQISITEATKIAVLAVPKQRQALQKLQASVRQLTLQKNKAKRQAQRQEPTEYKAQEIPQKRFDLLLIDPPWDYKNTAETSTINPQRHYPLMTNSQLEALPVKDLTKRDALVFLWCPSFHLPTALKLLEAWGCTFNTSFVRTKPHHVVGGGIFKMAHEFLIVGKRGAGLGKPEKLFFSWAQHPRQKVHSTKPKEFHEMIEAMYPTASRLEMFARETRADWQTWGNQ